MNDHEITALISASREKTRDELRAELDSLFKKEKDSLVERAQFLMNAAKWSAAALAIGFGLLGVKAWSDVSSHVEDHFKSRLEKTYLIDDATSPTRRAVDSLLDRALVNSLYARVLREKAAEAAERQRGRERAEPLALSPGELDRILRALKSPLTETSLFNDAVYVLNHLVVEEDRRQTVSAVLADLLAAKQYTESAWMSSNERKRLAILSTFNKSEGLDGAASDILAQPVPDRFKLAVLERIRRESVRNAAQNVLRLIDSSEEDSLKFGGYLTLAKIRPDHERVKQFVTADLMKRAEKNDFLQSVEIAAAIAASGSDEVLFPAEDTSEKRKKLLSELAVPLVSRAFDNGVALDLNEYGFNKGLSARIPIGPGSYRIASVDGAILSNDLAAQVLALGAGRSLKALSTYVTALTPKPGFGSSRAMSHVRIRAMLGGDSEIQLTDGTTLSSTTVRDNRVELLPDDSAAPTGLPGSGSVTQAKGVGGNSSGLLLAKWRDRSGNLSQGHVSEIRRVSFEVDASRLPRTEEEPDE